MGELRRLEDEVEGVEHNFDRVNSTLNFLEAKVNNLDQEARSINNIDLMQRLQSFCINRNEFIGDLKIIEIKLDALDLQITEASELQSGKLVEQSSMMYIRAKDDNVNLNEKDIIIEKLQEEMQNLDVQLKHCVHESDKLIEQQHQLESRTFELNRTSYSLKESLVQIRDKSTKLIPAIIEQAEIYSHSLSDKQAQLRKVEEAHKIQQDEIDAIHDDVHSNRTKNDNLESQLNNYLKIWREIDQKRIDKRNELEIKRASANQTQLELTQLEQELYLLQAQSIKDQPYNLVDTVEFLSFETEMIRSTLVEMQESTKEINDQVD